MRDKEFLNSWKEVARYVGRSQRTVQRWERDLGFPVHRPAGKLRASVIALASEVDAWVRASPQLRPSGSETVAPPAIPKSRWLPAIRREPPPLLLCIDDDAKGLRVRKAFLEAKGYRVLTASNGQAGTTLFEQNPIALVVLEYEMADLDCEVVARMLKRRKPAVPVVLLGGGTQLPASVARLVDGAVTKGEGPRVLLAAIEHWVRAPRPEQR